MEMKTTTKIEHIEVNDLIPYANNSRTHSEEQVGQIAASIREFGFTNPVLIDKDGTIVAGHGRVMAARKLGMESVPCIRLGHLSPAQVRAYVIADNKLALNAGWDEELLRSELDRIKEEGTDIALTGFSEQEITKLLQCVDADSVDFPELSDGDKQPFQQKTFTLHDEQSKEVDEAIEKAKKMGHGESSVNENSNGNALAFICEFFNSNAKN